MTDLPPGILAKAQFSPAEDIILPIIRAGMAPIRVQSLIEFDQGFPFVHTRRAQGLSADVGDIRFIDSVLLQVNTFAQDPDGDEKAAILGEACRRVLYDAYKAQTVVPNRGWIATFDMRQAPKRATDWATAVGPVQYADLPTGVVRYEAMYQLGLRRSFTPPYS